MAHSTSPPTHLVHGLLRLIAGFLFTAHGTQEMLHFPGGEGLPAHVSERFSQAWNAGAIEMVGGFLVLLGLYTRPAAFFCSGLMAFAYFIAHADRGFWPLINGGELAVIYCFVFLFLAVAGGGAFSLDTVLADKSRAKSKR